MKYTKHELYWNDDLGEYRTEPGEEWEWFGYYYEGNDCE